jgi:hypothetical protein
MVTPMANKTAVAVSILKERREVFMLLWVKVCDYAAILAAPPEHVVRAT